MREFIVHLIQILLTAILFLLTIPFGIIAYCSEASLKFLMDSMNMVADLDKGLENKDKK